MQQDRKGPAREQQPSSGSESRAADMEAAMQEKALRHASELLQSVPTGNRPNPTQLACAIKKEFDEVYGPAWHCIVGKSFGSFITHTEGGFIYFSIGSLSFLLFRTEVRPVVVPDSTFPTAKAKPR